jgi:hypothetical protein
MIIGASSTMKAGSLLAKALANPECSSTSRYTERVKMNNTDENRAEQQFISLCQHDKKQMHIPVWKALNLKELRNSPNSGSALSSLAPSAVAARTLSANSAHKLINKSNENTWNAIPAIMMLIPRLSLVWVLAFAVMAPPIDCSSREKMSQQTKMMLYVRGAMREKEALWTTTMWDRQR